KGIRFLIEAVGRLKNDPVELTLIGDGNCEEELKELAKDLGVSDRVMFKGYVNHDSIGEIYRKSDLFVLPSQNEGMSNALLEAMASGLSVIVTDTGGTTELLDGNGVVVPKGARGDREYIGSWRDLVGYSGMEKSMLALRKIERDGKKGGERCPE
ncbi:MAG: glycosyltransferase family 4 protein, partial [Deltaproteobacteria bacterium]|nr:glycosyltransferase family 4 protein [Deltaproteobacteria bacterium]